MKPDDIRDKEDIDKAHDLLKAVVQGELPNPFPEMTKDVLLAQLDLLCWVLRHENRKFAVKLEAAEALLAARGWVRIKVGT